MFEAAEKCIEQTELFNIVSAILNRFTRCWTSTSDAPDRIYLKSRKYRPIISH